MRIPNIYTERPLASGQLIELDGQAAIHLVKVLRMKAGHALNLFNGDGSFYPGEIVDTTKKSLSIQINQSYCPDNESPLYTHLGQVMSRGDRMDYAIQKSTEMGINEITPLTSERCELKIKSERADKKIQHWQQVAISAAEQCGRACVPKINAICTVTDWVAKQEKSVESINLVLHHRDRQRLTEIQSRPRRVNMLIGPEGGLTDEEITSACNEKFIACTFGPRVLRTETAPVAGLALLQWLWGDFNR